MKYRDPITGELKDIHAKVSDTLPIGTIVEYDGDTVPGGWETVDETSIYDANNYKSSDINIALSKLIKKNNRVVFNFSVSGTFSTNINKTIFNLPEELRPKTSSFFPVVGHTDIEQLKIGYVSINNAGNVVVRLSGSANGVIGNIVYDLD